MQSAHTAAAEFARHAGGDLEMLASCLTDGHVQCRLRFMVEEIT